MITTKSATDQFIESYKHSLEAKIFLTHLFDFYLQLLHILIKY